MIQMQDYGVNLNQAVRNTDDIRTEIIKRLQIHPEDDLDSAVPLGRDRLSEEDKDHLFTRMALTILRDHESATQRI